MKRMRLKALWLAAALTVAPVTLAGAAQPVDDGPVFAGRGVDNLSHPLGDEQAARRARALAAKLQGKAKGKTHEVAKGQYVELELERNDRVFVILAEFGNTIHPSYGQAPGPLHNQIAQPNRAVDNTTIWQADYNKAHYEDMYFTKMVDYYEKQSSGRYTINGDVVEWVKVPYNEARYGQNTSCGSQRVLDRVVPDPRRDQHLDGRSLGGRVVAPANPRLPCDVRQVGSLRRRRRR